MVANNKKLSRKQYEKIDKNLKNSKRCQKNIVDKIKQLAEYKCPKSTYKRNREEKLTLLEEKRTPLRQLQMEAATKAKCLGVTIADLKALVLQKEEQYEVQVRNELAEKDPQHITLLVELFRATGLRHVVREDYLTKLKRTADKAKNAYDAAKRKGKLKAAMLTKLELAMTDTVNEYESETARIERHDKAKSPITDEACKGLLKKILNDSAMGSLDRRRRLARRLARSEQLLSASA